MAVVDIAVAMVAVAMVDMAAGTAVTAGTVVATKFA